MIQVNRIYLIFNRLVTKKFLVDTSEQRNIQKQAKHQHKAVTLPHRKGDRFSVIKSVSQYVIH